ncbi:MAG TPA: TonB-dependent receptor [Steroidobacteraceae bacterium]|nr:TonB-dependent receptor [Steroidobacteraceae bacterium]
MIRIFTSAAVCVALFSASALQIAAAQTTPAAAPAPASPDALAEITVTAEKTTESLQKADAAITAVPSDIMIDSGITDLRQAQMIVPSVRFQAEGNTTQVFIRGVGANLDYANIEPNVAFNLAGIYMPREATSAAFFDIAQLEVLPGTQGTLYGRSAIGGTINITPMKPGFNNDGQILLDAGNYAAVHVTETQNIMVSQTVALRAAIDYDRNSGFMVTGADSKNNLSGRLSALVNPSDPLSIYLFAQAATKYGWASNLVNKGLNPATGQFCEECFFYGNVWNDTRTGPYAASYGTPAKEKSNYDTQTIGGQIDYRFGDFATLSYIPSYLYLNAEPEYWLSAIESTNNAHFNQVTQELKLAGDNSGPFKWLAGLYWYNSRNYGSEYLFTNLPFAFYQINVNSNQLKGEAVYGQLTYSITDSLRVTAGTRGSSTKRDADGFEVVALGGDPYTFDRTYNHVDWKAGIEDDLTSKIMAYGVIQTGFQEGTFNALPDTATYSNAVKPEELRSYTAGLKSRWLDDRLQINNEMYYYDFHNLIIQAYSISLPYNAIFNGDKIEIYGDQLDVLAKVFTDDQVSLNAGYSHARNIDVVDPLGNNVGGLQPAYAPDFTVLAGYTHNIPLGSATLHAHINWRFESSWWATYLHNNGTEQLASSKGDASLIYDTNGAWTVGLWVKNMTNKAVIAATAAAGIPGPATAYLEDPRTFGASFSYKY